MNVFDIIILLLLLFLTLIAARKGFLRAILNFGAVLAAGTAAKICSVPGAEYVYGSFIKKGLTKNLFEIMPSGSLSGEINSGINRIVDSLPSFVTDLALKLGIDTKALLLDQDSILTVTQVENDILKPIIIRVAAVIIIMILFVVFSILFKLVVIFFTRRLKDSKHKLMKRTDMILGGIFGFIKAVIPVGLICTLMSFLASVISNEQFSVLVDNSFFCQLILKLF